jgi:hypothetical protein
MASNPNNGPKMEPVTSKGVNVGTLKDTSAGRVMSIKGPKSAVAKGGLGARNSAPIVNND